MSGWLEVSVKGGNTALIDVSLVRGVYVPAKLKLWDASSPDIPLQVFLGDNRELDFYGPSAVEFTAMCEQVRRKAKQYPDLFTMIPRDSYTVDRAPHQYGFDLQIRYVVEPD